MTEQPALPENADRRDTLADRSLATPARSRLPLSTPGRSEILRAHQDALEGDLPGYTDPFTGLFVLSARFLADRGYCCERGCRHCPYVSDS